MQKYSGKAIGAKGIDFPTWTRIFPGTFKAGASQPIWDAHFKDLFPQDAGLVFRFERGNLQKTVPLGLIPNHDFTAIKADRGLVVRSKLQTLKLPEALEEEILRTEQYYGLEIWCIPLAILNGSDLPERIQNATWSSSRNAGYGKSTGGGKEFYFPSELLDININDVATKMWADGATQFDSRKTLAMLALLLCSSVIQLIEQKDEILERRWCAIALTLYVMIHEYEGRIERDENTVERIVKDTRSEDIGQSILMAALHPEFLSPEIEGVNFVRMLRKMRERVRGGAFDPRSVELVKGFYLALFAAAAEKVLVPAMSKREFSLTSVLPEFQKVFSAKLEAFGLKQLEAVVNELEIYWKLVSEANLFRKIEITLEQLSTLVEISRKNSGPETEIYDALGLDHGMPPNVIDLSEENVIIGSKGMLRCAADHFGVIHLKPGKHVIQVDSLSGVEGRRGKNAGNLRITGNDHGESEYMPDDHTGISAQGKLFIPGRRNGKGIYHDFDVIKFGVPLTIETVTSKSFKITQAGRADQTLNFATDVILTLAAKNCEITFNEFEGAEDLAAIEKKGPKMAEAEPHPPVVAPPLSAMERLRSMQKKAAANRVGNVVADLKMTDGSEDFSGAPHLCEGCWGLYPSKTSMKKHLKIHRKNRNPCLGKIAIPHDRCQHCRLQGVKDGYSYKEGELGHFKSKEELLAHLKEEHEAWVKKFELAMTG